MRACVCVARRVCMSVSQASLPTRPCRSPVHHFLCVAGSKLEMPISLCGARPSRRSPSPSTAHLARAAMNKFLPLSLPSFIHFFPSNLTPLSLSASLSSLLPSLFTPPLDCDWNPPVAVSVSANMDLWPHRHADTMKSVANKHLASVPLPSSVRLRGRRHQRPPGRPLRGVEWRICHRQPVQHSRYFTRRTSAAANQRSRKRLFPQENIFFSPLALMESVI